jgi:hypothetical protein
VPFANEIVELNHGSSSHLVRRKNKNDRFAFVVTIMIPMAWPGASGVRPAKGGFIRIRRESFNNNKEENLF